MVLLEFILLELIVYLLEYIIEAIKILYFLLSV